VNNKTKWAATALLAGATMHGAAWAQDAEAAPEEPGFFGSLFSDMDFSIGGFIRPEMSISTGDENPYNQGGNVYNGVAVDRHAGDPLTGFGPVLQAPVLAGALNALGLGGLTGPGTLVGNLLDAVPVVNGQLPLTDSVTRPIARSDNTFNMLIVRGELEAGIRFNSDLNLVARLRAIYDPDVYDDFDAHKERDGNGNAIAGGDPALYRSSRPNYFEYRVEGDSHPNPLEWAGRNYQLYFPALFLEYTRGPLSVRAGNQQIAWGQAIFFRVFDVVDGLDLRRHSVLDNAQEEFSDKRVPALGLRAGYQISDEWLADAYFQKFQPTVYGNPNTQYNVIPSQFTVHDMYSEGGYDDKFSYGLRLKGNYGQWGLQAMAVRRYNPDGMFRWTASNVNRNLPNSNLLGAAENLLNNGLTPNPLTGQTGTTGELLAQTPFEVAPGGVYSADEWFDYAARARLFAVDGLNAAINDFGPSTASLLASAAGSRDAAHNELDTFFMASGSALRGHIARDYYAENVFGLGASYVVEGEPGSILDQLIINLEASYTPNRAFTSPDLGQRPLREDSTIGALVLEKYQSFWQSFPATYLVLQYMHRTADDLFGRSLKGYGGTVDKQGSGISGGANYVVFALQQPFPQDIYRASLAVLYDPRGGILVQPGIKWKPRGSITVDAFYSYINGELGGNPNNNALSTADFADEFTLRLAYQF
jgi:hypothetical protein